MSSAMLHVTSVAAMTCGGRQEAISAQIRASRNIRAQAIVTQRPPWVRTRDITCWLRSSVHSDPVSSVSSQPLGLGKGVNGYLYSGSCAPQTIATRENTWRARTRVK